MFGCWKVRGLVAAAAYEKQDAEAQAILDAHLSGCARCSEKLEAFREVKSAVPIEPVHLNADLLPAIQRGLDGPPAKVFAFRPVPVGAMAAVLVVAGVSALMLRPASDPSGQVEPVDSGSASLLDTTFAEVENLVNKRDYMAAYLILVDGVASYPEDFRAGEAQQAFSDFAFDLKMYAKALDGYQALRLDYGDVWRGNVEENFMRLGLLEESQGPDNAFASLYQLDAARASGQFEDFEEIVGQNQLTYVADLAAEEMALLMIDSSGLPTGTDYVVAMEAALDRCSNPAAIAMLKIEVGDLIRNGDGNLERAQALYEDLAEDDAFPELASLARASLEAMEGDSGR